mgnify:CR=1 FL=1
MKRNTTFRIASSTALMVVTMAGCSGSALNTRAGTSAGKLEQMAASQAGNAEKALAASDAGRAIQIAEAAVAADPRNPAHRTLLGRAYLMLGRFESARTAFEDALTLGSTDGRAIVNLSLIHVAQGRSNDAQALLTRHVGTLSAADYGLAMAMAGNPDEAIRLLSQAIHAPGASARERQNLAYAYALAGQWTEARQMAAVDLPPMEAAKRVLGWAKMSQPGAESARVIAMMGVQPRGDDAGLPVRLALAPATDAPAALAQAAPVEAPALTDSGEVSAPAEIAYDRTQEESTSVSTDAVADAAAGPTQAAAAWSEAIASTETAQPLADEAAVPEFIPAPRAPLKVASHSAAAPVAAPLLRPTAIQPPLKAAKARPVAIWKPVEPTNGSAWVVQLGAYASRDGANAGWATLVQRNGGLGQFPVVRSEAMVSGRQFYRVAIAGFSDRAGAERVCASLRTRGSACFVRQGGAEAAPSRWAKAVRPTQLAMR